MSVAGTVEPGVDLAQVRGGGGATLRGRPAQGPLFLWRTQGRPVRAQVRFWQTRGLKALAVETGFKGQLTGDGFALIGLGSQSSDFGAVLVGLIAVGVEGSRAGARLPCLGLHHSGRGGDGDEKDENAKGDHEPEDGPFTAIPQA